MLAGDVFWSDPTDRRELCPCAKACAGLAGQGCKATEDSVLCSQKVSDPLCGAFSAQLPWMGAPDPWQRWLLHPRNTEVVNKEITATGHGVCENEPTSSTEGHRGDLFQNLAPSLPWVYGWSQAGTTSPEVPPETPLRRLHLFIQIREQQINDDFITWTNT